MMNNKFSGLKTILISVAAGAGISWLMFDHFILPPHPPLDLWTGERTRQDLIKLGSDEIRIFAPEGDANIQTLRGLSSDLVSNVQGVVIDERTVVTKQSIPVLDLGWATYDKEFANRFGYPTEFIDEMPEHVHMYQMIIQTRGSQLVCRLGMLVDKGLGLNLPPAPYWAQLGMANREGYRFPMPGDRIRNYRDFEDVQFYKNVGGKSGGRGKPGTGTSFEEYRVRNYFTSTTEYRPDVGDGNWSMTGTFLQGFYPHYYLDMDFIEVTAGCGPISMREFLSPRYFIWAKKEGGLDYMRHGRPQPKDFMQFEVPRKFRNRIGKYMRDISIARDERNTELLILKRRDRALTKEK